METSIMNNRLLVASLAAICVAAAHPALGQGAVDNKTAQELKKEDSVPPATGRSLPEQAGTTEPSSKAKSGTDENVFVNGVLTVPGAPTDVDTAPAKFSERTAADDRLPIVGYRLKQLSEAQRREIAQQLSVPSGHALSPADLKGYAVLGAELPGPMAMQALTPLPQALTEKYPELRGTAFMPSDGKMLIVDLDNNLVVGVLEG
jgi:hypothetical protein